MSTTEALKSEVPDLRYQPLDVKGDAADVGLAGFKRRIGLTDGSGPLVSAFNSSI